MSNVSNRHTVVEFVSGKSVAFTGQRLSRCLYKPDRKTKVQKYKSVCASIPVLEIELDEENIEKLAPYILNMLEETQDKIFKSLYESKDGKLSSISDDDINLNAIIGYLENESSGGRFTKEFLNAWFDENMKDNLSVAIAEKLGMKDPSESDWEVINKSVHGYREMIASLSGGATLYSPNQCKSLIKALEIASVEDEVNKKLVGRLNKMLNPTPVAEFLSLD
jgi:hypothetical protein